MDIIQVFRKAAIKLFNVIYTFQKNYVVTVLHIQNCKLLERPIQYLGQITLVHYF